VKRFFAFSALLGWCAVLLALRFARANNTSYFFLVWNLFLAAIPFAAALAMDALDRAHWRVASWIAFIAWLLFLPNAPYILTDFIHLRERMPIPLWYDVLLLLSCAGTGLLLGYGSMMLVQRVIERRHGVVAGWFVAAASMVLSAFGIYLGRFLRRNSWDALSEPGPLFADIARRVIDPFAYPKTIAVTVLYGVALMLGYVALHVLAETSVRDEA
jgi:uncharacterized membrane protein